MINILQSKWEIIEKYTANHMKVRNFFSQLYQVICKDTGELNESSKLISVVRMLTLSMIVDTFVNTVIFFFASLTSGLILGQLSMIVFLAIFVMSYYQRTFASYCALNFSMLVWIVANVHLFGWDTGVQTFIFVLVVFCFFAKYKRADAKIAYVIILLLIRMYLYFYCENNAPTIDLASGISDAIQILNSIIIFWLLSLVAYFFSTDTQALEGKLIEYNEQLKTQASIDPLTGLHNRRSTMEYLDRLLKNAETQISICLCDIDFFKRVNDTYGHDVGDVVLEKIAETFLKELPQESFVSRWGGEEFLLIFPQSNGDEAMVELQSLSQKIKAIVFDGGSATFSVSLTFGLVEYDFHSDLTAILKEADEKLYLGKDSGRDRIIF